MSNLRFRLLGLIIVVGGWAAAPQPAAAAFGGEVGCVRCVNACPPNVEVFCAGIKATGGAPCGTSSTFCSEIDCEQKPIAISCLTIPE